MDDQLLSGLFRFKLVIISIDVIYNHDSNLKTVDIFDPSTIA